MQFVRLKPRDGAPVAFTIDGRPAAEVYNQWLGGALQPQLDGGGVVLAQTALHPLAVKVGQVHGLPHYLLVHPEAITPGHSLRTFCDLRVGDRLLARPGARFAADGLVEEGQGSADESMLTGESVPQMKSPGARVLAGTLNGPAPLVYRAQATGSATRVSRAVLMVEPLSIDKGEVTDKGSLNQRAVLTHREALVDALYAGTAPGLLLPSVAR